MYTVAKLIIASFPGLFEKCGFSNWPGNEAKFLTDQDVGKTLQTYRTEKVHTRGEPGNKAMLQT